MFPYFVVVFVCLTIVLLVYNFLCTFYNCYGYFLGVRGGAVGLVTAIQAGRSRTRFPVVSLEFFIGIILPAALWPWG